MNNSDPNFSRRSILTTSLAALVGMRATAHAAVQTAAKAPTSAYDLGPGVHYLNHASIGTVPRAVREAHAGYLAQCESNPWLYVWNGAWDEPFESARSELADFCGASSNDIAFLRNTTEAFSLLANGLALGADDEVLFSSLNHTGASRAFELAGKARGYRVRRFEFPVAEVPKLSAADVVRLHVEALSEQTKLLVVPHVDNQVGLKLPLRELARAARTAGVRWIAVDGAQTVGAHPLALRELGCDLYATSGHKWLQGPKGTGLAYVSPELRDELRPIIATWGHDRWKDSARVYEDYGTRDLASVLALADAARFQTSAGWSSAATAPLHARILEHVQGDERISLASANDPSLSGSIVTIAVSGADSRALARTLFEQHGFVVRPFQIGQRQALRLSPNRMNTLAEIDGFFEALRAELS